jgi:AcrR family transcriptional regulator
MHRAAMEAREKVIETNAEGSGATVLEPAGRAQGPGTRDRIVIATAELFRRRGYTGTGVKQIAAEAEAPFGSIYHFFPGGKEQLGEEVIRSGGQFFLQLYETIADGAPDVVTGTKDFFYGAAQTLRDTDYADACPIATVALEVASTNEQLRQATADVFELWLGAMTARLTAAGIAAAPARELAVATLAALEGAFLLSRATRSPVPVEVAGDFAAAAVRDALAAAGA